MSTSVPFRLWLGSLSLPDSATAEAAGIQPSVVPSDPFFAYPAGWHLGPRIGHIEKIWDDFTGLGIKVGVYGIGVQSSHPDLDGNYDAANHVVLDGVYLGSALGYQNDVTCDGVFVSNPNTDKRYKDTHGTAVAGIIAAEKNGIGGVGVAYDVTFTSVNFIGTMFFSLTDPDTLTAEGWVTDGSQAIAQATRYDVMNNSWGSPAAFTAGNTRPYSYEAQWQHVVSTGRHIETTPGGFTDFGTIIVKSAGNDDMDANGDFDNASRETITVSAIGNVWRASSYSNYGASILVGAPAGGGADRPG